MLEKLMPKGWTQLVDEAIAKTIQDEIHRQLEIKFCWAKGKNDMRDHGFSYAMREYIEKRWADILKADPELDAIIRSGLKSALLKGFGEKPE